MTYVQVAQKKWSLLNCLTLPIDYGWGHRIDTRGGLLFFRDNGAKVLGVAHLDYVGFQNPIRQDNIVRCTQLDDRLGVWCLLNLLPKFGVKTDVLLTDNEERCRSTGQYFQPSKAYNWIVEFDRAGSDVVFYHYDIPRWENVWQDWKIGLGSYSDILVMDHLGVCAANIGTGYYLPHTNNCYADLNVTVSQVKKFAQFWRQYKNTRFEYTDQQESFAKSYDFGERYCQECGNYQPIEDFCKDCGTCLWTVGEEDNRGIRCGKCGKLHEWSIWEC